MDIVPTTSVLVHQKTPLVAKIIWAIAMLCSLAGGFFGIMDYANATSAPQQAAAAAIGCLIAVAPYTFARAVEALSN